MVNIRREKAKKALRQTKVAVILGIVFGLPLSGWLMNRAFEIDGKSPTCMMLGAVGILLAGLYLVAAHFINYVDYRVANDERIEEAAKKQDSRTTA